NGCRPGVLLPLLADGRARSARRRASRIDRRPREGVDMSPRVIGMTGLLALLMCASASAADIDWSKVDQAMGKKGSDQPGGVHKYGLPRSDLNVTVDGVAIKPALALGSWLAFQPTTDGAMFMGDLVLTDTEISPVMQRLIEGGVEITAVHNHLLRTSVPV